MANRRVNGEGTIYRRKDGRYEVAIFVSTTSGRIKRVRKYAASRGEADRKLTELKSKLQQGIPVPDKSVRLGDYLDYWLSEIIKPTRRPATYEKYETIARLHVKPGFGSVQLERLTVPMLQAFLNELQRSGMSLANVHEVRKTLSSVLTRAMKEELLYRNVARLVDLETHESPEVEPWSVAEVVKFLDAARNDPLYPAFMLSLFCGLRRGEVLGLRWADINFETRVLKVRQQIRRGRGGLVVGAPKTKKSARDLRLPPSVIAELARHYQTQDLLRQQFGSFWPWQHEDELVFTTCNGRPIEPRNYVRSFKRICEQHNIRSIRVHDMRHTMTTLASQGLVSPKDIQFTLGHSKISTTLEKYDHASIESSDRVFTQLEAMITGQGDVSLKDNQGMPWSEAFMWRCRQMLPSRTFVDVLFTSFISGIWSEGGVIEHRLTIDTDLRLSERVHGVNAAFDVRRRQSIIGLAAVTAAVKVEDS